MAPHFSAFIEYEGKYRISSPFTMDDVLDKYTLRQWVNKKLAIDPIWNIAVYRYSISKQQYVILEEKRDFDSLKRCFRVKAVFDFLVIKLEPGAKPEPTMCTPRSIAKAAKRRSAEGHSRGHGHSRTHDHDHHHHKEKGKRKVQADSVSGDSTATATVTTTVKPDASTIGIDVATSSGVGSLLSNRYSTLKEYEKPAVSCLSVNSLSGSSSLRDAALQGMISEETLQQLAELLVQNTSFKEFVSGCIQEQLGTTKDNHESSGVSHPTGSAPPIPPVPPVPPVPPIVSQLGPSLPTFGSDLSEVSPPYPPSSCAVFDSSSRAIQIGTSLPPHCTLPLAQDLSTGLSSDCLADGTALASENSKKIENDSDKAIPVKNEVRHRAICDNCNTFIVGNRYKCINCPDFDLCSKCNEQRSTSHPSHTFLEISVSYSNRADSWSKSTSKPTAGPSSDTLICIEMLSGNEYHSAVCDICENSIRGERYKCMDCPDFDFCNNCFPHRSVNHPAHRFVRIRNPEDFFDPHNSNLRYYCDGPYCKSEKLISGDRYQCQNCPDTDLCIDCMFSKELEHDQSHSFVAFHADGGPGKFVIKRETGVESEAQVVNERVVPKAEQKDASLSDLKIKTEEKSTLDESDYIKTVKSDSRANLVNGHPVDDEENDISDESDKLATASSSFHLEKVTSNSSSNVILPRLPKESPFTSMELPQQIARPESESTFDFDAPLPVHEKAAWTSESDDLSYFSEVGEEEYDEIHFSEFSDRESLAVDYEDDTAENDSDSNIKD
ncbi:hypothetical protein AWJ20_1745 [Sugiyamaella lignohabitans]|uniref:ZZ-type domain-containing protein n=1 Tax=Sugiyamaella lignohabitans TaxID=796027 RepID=A0A167DYV4_9ASCO|nr:uncharacterized protein AWJ20_1745 [Sugiyamaella lignohabitans]ANB13454.1 hypothetical protein AWJ20_1745 [Sugiyamaella lignohabitans]